MRLSPVAPSNDDAPRMARMRATPGAHLQNTPVVVSISSSEGSVQPALPVRGLGDWKENRAAHTPCVKRTLHTDQLMNASCSTGICFR